MRPMAASIEPPEKQLKQQDGRDAAERREYESQEHRNPRRHGLFMARRFLRVNPRSLNKHGDHHRGTANEKSQQVR